MSVLSIEFDNRADNIFLMKNVSSPKQTEQIKTELTHRIIRINKKAELNCLNETTQVKLF